MVGGAWLAKLVGDNWLVTISWRLVGGNWWVPIGWWQLVGDNWLMTMG